MWLPLSCASAALLGLYDIAKKKAVDGNAVLPTLLTTTAAGALCTLPVLALSAWNPGLAMQWHLHIPAQPLSAHLLILLKSAIVASSWLLSYLALKHLPLTVATPLRATAPLFTILGAVLLFGERPTILQWLGIASILASYLLYSAGSGRKPGARAAWPWMALMILAALTGAASAGFDKYLLQARGLPPIFVLGFFLPYQTLLTGLLLLVLTPFRRRDPAPFRFRPSMLMVGVLLVSADFAYMTALSNPLAKLSIVSAVRRTNVLVSFLGGALLFHEGDLRRKLVPFAGILIGLGLLLFG